jgi:Tfp pilus assembly protein FimT
VELLLVMTIMAVAIAVAAPTLGNFFRGRTLDSEARRLLALTHSGQSRAVSEGVPMRLWVDTEERTYGLKEDPGWDDTDPKAVEFTMDQDLHVEVVKAEAAKRPSLQTQMRVGTLAGALAGANTKNLPEIRFLPDGSIDPSSPRALRLYDRDDTSLWIAQATNRLDYEIRNSFE